MDRLSKMANIGEVVEQKLIQVGIASPDELKAIGSKEAFKMIRLIDDSACLSMLCALEGAIEGIRWHYLDDAVKADLKSFFEGLK